jgi:hypothetical protein
MTARETDRPPPRRRRDAPASDMETNEQYVRRLARAHCRIAIRALAGVAFSRQIPPAVRVTAATNLVTWALGGGGEEAGPMNRINSGKRAAQEQVVRLAWMEPKSRTRDQQKRTKSASTSPESGKLPATKKDR